jgi:hypothetical protein
MRKKTLPEPDVDPKAAVSLDGTEIGAVGAAIKSAARVLTLR